MVFKCRSCGSCMIYDFTKKGLICPNCESMDDPDIEYDNKNDLNICPICGGNLNLGKYGTSVKCGYCDSYVVSDIRLAGDNAPLKIVPTTITKKEMFDLLIGKFSGYMCLIPEVFSPSRLKEVIIEYVPFWVYRFDTKMEFSGQIKESVTTGNTTVRDTYSVSEIWDLTMRHVPVDASDRMPDRIMDELEPFVLGNALDFKPEYLSGSESELFNHESEFYKEQASYKVSDMAYEFMADKLRQRYKHADNISPRMIRDNTDINMTTLSGDFYMLPVYKYSYTFKDGRKLDYYVNGQTKEIFGKAPISTGRLWAAVVATLTAFMGAAALVATILMLIGGAV